MRALVTAFALFLGLTTSVLANEIRITGIDPGGDVETYTRWWDRVAAADDTVVIDGACISACTIFLGKIAPERVCMTEKAVLGLHRVSGTPNDDDMTEIYVRMTYPKWIQDMIIARGPLKTWPMWFYPEDLWPNIQMCPGHELPERRQYTAPGQEEEIGGEVIERISVSVPK